MRLKSLPLVVALLLSSTTLLSSPPALTQATDIRQTDISQDEAFRLLQQASEQYRNQQYHTAIQTWKQSLSLHLKLGNRWSESFILYQIGLAYNALHEYDQAIDYLQQSLTINRQLKAQDTNNYFTELDRIESDVLQTLGVVYRELRQYDQAIDYLQQSLAVMRVRRSQNLYDTHVAREGMAELANGQERLMLEMIAQIYDQMGQSDKAASVRQQTAAIPQAQGISMASNPRKIEADRLFQQGGEQYNANQVRAAIQSWEKALQIYRQMQNRWGESASLTRLGAAYDFLGDSRKAIEFYQQSLVIIREIGDLRGEGEVLSNLGSAYDYLGEFRQAITRCSSF